MKSDTTLNKVFLIYHLVMPSGLFCMGEGMIIYYAQRIRNLHINYHFKF